MRALTALLLLAPTAAAQPRSVAEQIAPLVDENTLLVGHLDAGRLDLRPIEAALASLSEDGPGPGISEFAKHLVAAARAAGLKDVYTVYSLADLPLPPPVLIPAEQAEKLPPEQVRALSEGLGNPPAEVRGFRVFGPPPTVERLKALKPVPRPELAEALNDAGESTLRVVVLPTADFRRAFEEVSPQLPKALGGGPVQLLTRDLKWAALTGTAGEDLPVRVVVQAADADAARALKDLTDKLFDWVGDQPVYPQRKPVRELYGKVYSLARELLTPELAGDQLRVSFRARPALVEVAKLLRRHPVAGLRVSQNNLKQIGLAIHNYHDVNGHLPANVVGKDGKVLLSWRVLLLPYLEQEELYKQFKLDEPWDSEHNRKLVEKMPEVFRSPVQDRKLVGKTTYLAPVGKDTIFPGEPIRIQDISDGTSNTIMVVEASDPRAVIWTRPDDLPVGGDDPLPDLTGHYMDGFNALFGDGSVRFVSASIDPKTLRALFTRNGGEVTEIP
ncbi:MAG TPA: DUF1559 domain-containing protein [Gemmataceae bacterium]